MITAKGADLRSAYPNELGTRFISYRGGEVVAYVNRYYFGSLEKRPFPKNKIIRWLIDKGVWPTRWAYQVNAPDGACMACHEYSRPAAIAAGKKYIDERLDVQRA